MNHSRNGMACVLKAFHLNNKPFFLLRMEMQNFLEGSGALEEVLLRRPAAKSQSPGASLPEKLQNYHLI